MQFYNSLSLSLSFLSLPPSLPLMHFVLYASKREHIKTAGKLMCDTYNKYTFTTIMYEAFVM